jgi:hypothetical protein
MGAAMRRLRSMLVGSFAEHVLMLVAIPALVLALLLAVTDTPTEWLAWSGAALSAMALAILLLLACATHALDRISDQRITTIYIPLLNEGIDVWRPVEAVKVAELGYMVTETAPPDEEWVFQPGHILRCEERQVRGEKHLVAVADAF